MKIQFESDLNYQNNDINLIVNMFREHLYHIKSTHNYEQSHKIIKNATR
jgi:hypothetical protein